MLTCGPFFTSVECFSLTVGKTMVQLLDIHDVVMLPCILQSMSYKLQNIFHRGFVSMGKRNNPYLWCNVTVRLFL